MAAVVAILKITFDLLGQIQVFSFMIIGPVVCEKKLDTIS